MIENIKENLEEGEYIIEKDIQQAEKEWHDDMPDYDYSYIEGHSFSDIVEHFRWAVNALFVAAPVCIIETASFAFNIYESIAWQNWWAKGNLFLIVKTVFQLLQLMSSLPLIFEIDVYLRHMKLFRVLSLFAALAYNIVYFGTIAIWYYQIYNPPSWMDYSVFSMFMNLFLAYNMLFDFLTVPSNIAIITKEFTMEFF